MSAEKFFVDNINRLPKGPGGLALEPEKHNLYHGLYVLAKQISEIQDDQRKILQELRQLRSRLP